jgi:hypothetical protein
VEKKKPHAISEIVSRLATSLRQQQVRGVGERAEEGVENAQAVELHAVPDLDHQRQPGQRETERDPDPAANVLVQERSCVDRDEHRAEVLDQERDRDREAVDREEVRQLHARDADGAEKDEPRELATRDAQRAG